MRDWLTLRNAFGALLLVLFFKSAATTQSGTGSIAMTGGMGTALVAMSFLILSACCFSRTLSEVLSRPFTRLIDGVYFGNNDREPPPLNLRLPEAYRRDYRYEEAITEYERQLQYHPRSAVLWSELIRTAREAGNPDMARAFLRRALRRVERGERLPLEREFGRL